jgi:hypothetical protein
MDAPVQVCRGRSTVLTITGTAAFLAKDAHVPFNNPWIES